MIRFLKFLCIRLIFLGVIAVFLLGCATAKKFNALEHRESFLHVVRDVTFGVCSKGVCKESSSRIMGSGFVVAQGLKDSFGLTAGHLCEDQEPPPGITVKDVKSKFLVRLTGGRSYEASVEQIYPELDICVLRLRGALIPGLDVSSTPPKVGVRYYTLSSPRGIFGNQMVPVFSGTFSGRVSKYNHDFYTIPATGGSSGSPIMDVNGRVVGLTSMAIMGFGHLAISVPYEGLRDIIYSVKQLAASERYRR